MRHPSHVRPALVFALALILPCVAAPVAAAQPAPVVEVHQVQGAGHLSRLVGRAVAGVRGVVVATDARQDTLWLESIHPDDDPATSEAIQVVTQVGSVRPGDLIEVSGTVEEHREPADTPDNPNLTVTRIAGPAAVTILGRHPLPAPIWIGARGRIPPDRVVKDDTNGNVEENPAFNPYRQGMDFWESLESMYVCVEAPVAVSPTVTLGQVKQVTVVADNGAEATVLSDRGALPVREFDPNPERITITSALDQDAVPADVNVGDRLSAACGVVDYRYGLYEILATSPLFRTPAGLARQVTAPAAADELSIATFNVENLSAVSPAEKVAGLARTITNNVASPDIVTVEEVQDDDGPAQTGTTTAERSWRSLIDAIVAAGGPRYDYRQIDPLDGADGGIPGGNIRVGFLFRTDIGLSFVDRPGGTATRPVRIQPDGSLDVSPGRIQPDDPAFANTRKSLAAEFVFRGARVVVVANHLSSLSGDDPIFGRFQPARTPSRVKRGKQTAVLADFARDLLAHDPATRLVLAGDFNDTEFSPPLRTLRELGLTDLPATLPERNRYTYIYQGNGQVLDHILLSPRLADARYHYQIVHVNAEFVDQVSDHDPQVVRLRFP